MSEVYKTSTIDKADELFITIAVQMIQEKEGIKIPKKPIKGTIECPKCKKELHYRINTLTGRIWGMCSTEKCLEWFS